MTARFPSLKRKAAFVLAIFESFLFGGTIFGWNSLVYVFQKQGYYSQRTHPPGHGAGFGISPSPGFEPSNSSLVAAEDGGDYQAKMFNLIFVTTIFFLNSSSVVTGWMFDTYGTRCSKLVFIVLLSLGYFLFAISTPENSWILFPAAILVAVCGNGLMITNVHIGNLFVKRRSLVISLLYGFFDSSGSVALLVQMLFDWGLPTRAIFTGWAVMCYLLLLNTFCFLPPGQVAWPPPEEYFDVKELDKKESRRSAGSGGGSSVRNRATTIDRFSSNANMRRTVSLATTSFGRASMSTIHLPRLRTSVYNGELDDSYPEDDESIVEEEKSLASILCSSVYMFQVLWFILLSFVVNFFIGTYFFRVHSLLESHHDTAEAVSMYNTALQLALFTGFLWCPIAGVVMDRHRKEDVVLTREQEMEYVMLPLFLTSCIAFVFQLTTLLASFWSPALVIAAILLAILRGFLYTLGGAFFLFVFPTMYFGKLLGIEVFASSVCLCGQYFLENLVRGRLQGDPFYVNIFLLILVFLSLIHPFNLLLLNFHRKRVKQIGLPITEQHVIIL